MKSVNYGDLRNDEVLRDLEVGDQILLAPDSIRSTKTLNMGWIEVQEGTIRIVQSGWNDRDIIYIDSQEFDALKEAIELAKKIEGET